MRVLPLQSGSAGNCCYVEANGVQLLFDFGVSATKASKRLEANGVGIRSIDAIFISHEHSDHVSGAGHASRKFGLPVHITEGTLRAASDNAPAIPLAREFVSGASVQIANVFGTVTVETIRTPHDAKDGVVFIVDDGCHRLGICTDFGHVFGELRTAMESLDAVVLESNYDERMLADGPYPAFLKRRISGGAGHISNRAAAELLASHGGRLRWAYLAHLSANNNDPELALATHRAIVRGDLPLHLAHRYECSPALCL
jgi:phosphoribosyl 1,2-cyclic phosphodiesterase